MMQYNKSGQQTNKNQLTVFFLNEKNGILKPDKRRTRDVELNKSCGTFAKHSGRCCQLSQAIIRNCSVPQNEFDQSSLIHTNTTHICIFKHSGFHSHHLLQKTQGRSKSQLNMYPKVDISLDPADANELTLTDKHGGTLW